MSSPRRSLIIIAKDAEDVANALHNFRDQLPRHATKITSCISELFALSLVLREISNGEGDIQFSTSFYQVEDDLTLVVPSMQCTLADSFQMLTNSRDWRYQRAWDELDFKINREAGSGLLDRLEMYRAFLRMQADTLQRRRSSGGKERLRQDILLLLDAQSDSKDRAERERRFIDISAARARPSRVELPTSPLSASETWSDYLNAGARLPPRTPEPPRVPLSPTYTFASNSSHTFSSSQTSYSSDQVGAKSSRMDHWVQNVFDGSNPGTPFDNEFQLDVRSSCNGTHDPQALNHLRRDGFVKAVEIPFNKEQCRVRFYFRPHDNRARLLIMTLDDRGRDLHYCAKLGNMRVFRDGSSLQLCRYKGGDSYTEWARLNFYLYERMVLFYCTFVAMKRQDSQPIPDIQLLEDTELEGVHPEDSNTDEFQEFGGQIQDGDMLHTLRIYRDNASGVVRLEASAFRGPMSNVPLWTAFVTRYAHDPDYAVLEGGGVVSFAATKPPPYLFAAGYALPKNERGEYFVQFTSDDDAQAFMEIWTRLCRSNRG